jgi:3-hydroxyisobutyrate dehydrogenase-like beta-hydroxyacid dehydrogenase
MNIGFIGLGNMGSPIAANLLKAKHTLRVWNRSPESARKLASHGAQVVATSAEAFRGDVVFSMLGDEKSYQSVFLDSGLLDGASGDTVRIHVNMATVAVAFADEFAARHKARGIAYVAAPVLGRPDAAAAGKLNIMAAGPASALDTVQPLLDVVGQKTWRFGEVASRANVAKICLNFMLAAAIEAMGETAALAEGYGIPASDILELASQTAFTGPVYQGYGRLIAESRYEPAGFKARLGLKDVRAALAAADAVTTPMPTASLIHDSMLEVLARGEGEKEFGVVLGRAAMRRAGR